MADERPFAAGSIAAALGLAIGLAIPETEREDELMGSAKDALIERGRETVRDAAGRVQNVAAEVQRVAGDALTGTSSADEESQRPLVAGIDAVRRQEPSHRASMHAPVTSVRTVTSRRSRCKPRR
jgi:hypothetical protein